MEADAGGHWEEDWPESIGEPPDDPWAAEDEITAVTASERESAAAALADFWTARPVLKHIHQFAQARMAGPWAVLGAVLCRVLTATPPMAQIPPTIGSWAACNLFVGMVGVSGDGKGIAESVAEEAVDLGAFGNFYTVPVGSGEGLGHVFMRPSARKGGEPELFRQAALVTVGEVDTLGALSGRSGSTLLPQLRHAAMGEPLGFHYADSAKRMIVPKHMYRLCLSVGIQPERSAILLDDAAGGTPQRFVWLPVVDRESPPRESIPEQPVPILWESPNWGQAERVTVAGMPRVPIRLPKIARDAILDARWARNHGLGDALDGHALLTRAKVAVGFGALDSRTFVDEFDWELAGVVMTVSDQARARCVEVLREKQRQKNVGQAVAEAERAVVVSEKLTEATLQRIVRYLRRKLAEGPREGMTHGALYRKVPARDREHFESAIDALVATGEVIRENVKTGRQDAVRYCLVI